MEFCAILLYEGFPYNQKNSRANSHKTDLDLWSFLEGKNPYLLVNKNNKNENCLAK